MSPLTCYGSPAQPFDHYGKQQEHATGSNMGTTPGSRSLLSEAIHGRCPSTNCSGSLDRAHAISLLDVPAGLCARALTIFVQSHLDRPSLRAVLQTRQFSTYLSLIRSLQTP